MATIGRAEAVIATKRFARHGLLAWMLWWVVHIFFLVGFRIGLNITDSNVIDVGYAGVIGADKITDAVTWASHIDMETGRPVETPIGDTPIARKRRA